MKHTERILQIVEERKIVPNHLAKVIGISDSLISKWRANPSLRVSSEILVAIADYLDCSVDYLLGRTENPELK